MISKVAVDTMTMRARYAPETPERAGARGVSAGDDDGEDDGADVRPHDSRAVRVLLLVVGSVSVALGVLGIFLPVLPTTPFLLLAAACFARASERFYLWLLRNPAFGPTIREWRRHRSIPYRTKVVALALMTITIGLSIVLLARYPLVQLALAAVGVGVGAWLYRIPSRNHRQRMR